jgi:hypothetical protein
MRKIEAAKQHQLSQADVQRHACEIAGLWLNVRRQWLPLAAIPTPGGCARAARQTE